MERNKFYQVLERLGLSRLEIRPICKKSIKLFPAPSFFNFLLDVEIKNHK